MAPRPTIGAENLNFLKLLSRIIPYLRARSIQDLAKSDNKLLKPMIVGAIWFHLGLLSIRILCFLKSDKK